MYHALLFFHVLSAFLLAAAIVMYSAFVLGSPVNRLTRLIAEIAWGIGGLGTLVLGIWLALNRPRYDLLDGWIIAAILLWILATGSGARASRGVQPAADGGPLVIDARTRIAHWMRVVYFVALLAVMIWKPGV